MIIKKVKKSLIFKLNFKLGIFILPIFLFSFVFFVNKVSAIDGIMNGKTVTGQTDNYLFWLQTFDKDNYPFYFDQFFVNKSGSVGIGNAAPAYKLDVSGTGRFTQPVLIGTPTAAGHAATKNYVDSTIGGGSGSTVGYWTMNGTNISNSNTGNVGIGTTGPIAKLQVSAGAVGGSAPNLLRLTNTATTDGSGTSIYMGYNANLADPYGIRLVQRGNPSSYRSGIFEIQRHNTAAGDTDADWLSSLYINQSGNIGIGTTSPSQKLHVDGSIRLSNTSGSADISTDSGGSIYFKPGNGATYFNGPGNNRFYAYDYSVGAPYPYLLLSAHSLVLNVPANGGAGAVRLTDSGSSYLMGGNVGIGTTAPTYALDVTGTGRFTQPVLVGTPTAAGHATTKSYVDSTAVAAAGGGIPAAVNGYTLRASGTSWVANSNLYNDGTNVGIGTTNPTSLLHLNGTNANIRVQNSGYNTGQSSITFGHGGSVNEKTGIVALANGTWGKSDLYFVLDSDNDSGPFGVDTDSKMMIKNSGNVGIGTTAPAYKLDVTGTGRFTQPVLVGAPTAAGHATTKSYVDSTIGGGSGSTVGYWTMNGTNISNSNTGNVGIGTTNPTNGRLVVQGTNVGDTSAIAVQNSVGTRTFYVGNNGKVFLDGSQKIITNIGSTGWLELRNNATGNATLQSDISYNLLLNPNGGNVGIGNSAPAYKLDVTGTGRFTQPVLVGTPTAAGHATTKSYVDSTAVSAAGGGVGAGTTGQTLRHNGTSWVANSVLFNNGTNVGIGTTGPTQKLDVMGSSGLPSVSGAPTKGNIRVRGGGSGTVVLDIGEDASTGSGWLQVYRDNDATQHYNLLLNPNGGNVGIGITTPTTKLHVGGTMAGGDPFYAAHFSNLLSYGAGTGLGPVRITLGRNSTVHGYIEAGSSSDNDSSNGYMAFGTRRPVNSITEAMRIDRYGNVGIGTTAPAYKLDVTGTGRFTQPVLVGTPTAAGHATTKSYVDSTAVAAAGGGVGAGTSGQTLRHNGTSWVANSTLYNNGTNVGIGITNPVEKLQVAGDIKANGLLVGNQYMLSGVYSYTNGILVSTDIAVSDNMMMELYIEGNSYSAWGAIGGKVTAYNSTASGAIVRADYVTYGFAPSQIKIFHHDGFVKLWMAQTSLFQTYRFRLGTFSSPRKITNIQNAAMPTAGVTNEVVLTPKTVINNNVGIGTAAPGYKLDVSGTGRFTQPVIVGAPTLDGHAATKNYVDSTIGGGSGSTVGYWTMSGANIYNSNTTGNVGIGTTNPSVKTHIQATDARLRVDSTTSGNIPYLQLFNSGDSKYGALGYDTTNEEFIFSPQGSIRMVIESSGNVGIGTTAPAYKLDVTGTGRFTQPVIVGAPTATNHATTKSYVDSAASSAAGGGVGAGTTGQTLRHNGTSWVANSVLFNNGTNVGIGTTAPIGKLFVGSDWRTSHGGTNLYVGAGAGITSTSDLGITYSVSNASTAAPSVVGMTLYNDDTTAGGWSPLLLFSKAESGPTPYKSTMAGIAARTPTGIGSGDSWIDGELHFYTAGTGTNGLVDRMVINKDGSVGIGTTAPAYKLDVTGTGRFTQPVIVGAPTATNHATTKSYVDSAAGGGVGAGSSGQTLRHNGTSWVANSVLFNNGTNVGIGTTAPGEKLTISSGNIKLYSAQNTADAYRYIGTEYNPGNGNNKAEIRFAIDGADTKTRLTFHTANGAGTINEQMRITSSGNVGIGTTAPKSRLHVQGGWASTRLDGDNVTIMKPSYVGGWARNLMRFQEYTGTDYFVLGAYGSDNTFGYGYIGEAYTDTWLRFYPSGMKVAIDQGSLGIGTTAPTYKLDVSGTGRFTQPVIVGAPTAAGHAVTKSYVDSAAGGGVGAGTTGQTLRHNGTSWVANSVLFNNGTNVGIGTTNPGAKLDVSGGSIRTNNQLISTLANGTAPIVVSSATKVTNLNADLIDGFDSSDFAYADKRSYNSVVGDNGVDDWYSLFQINDASVSPVICNIKAYAHTSATFVVSKGYSGGNGMISIINANTATVNGSYKYLKGVRLTSDGIVQIKLNAGAIVGISAEILSSGSSALALFTTLNRETGSPTITDSVDPLINGLIRAKGALYSSSGNSYFGGNVGIGNIAPAYKLDVTGTGRFTQPVIVGAPTAAGHAVTKSYVDSAAGGGVGAGTTGQTLRHNGTSWVANSNLYNNGTSVGIGTTNPGTYKLNVAGSAYIGGALELSAGSNLVTSGTISANKINVGTIDPLYNLGGVNYASFAASVVGGVKEETTGRLVIDQKVAGEYQKTIDFKRQTIGSDLWVWYNVIDFSKENVEVLLTPYGKSANVYYSISGEKLIFHSDVPVEVSYRLIAKRFDWKNWPTEAKDQSEKPNFILK
jgi:hypothetical protein